MSAKTDRLPSTDTLGLALARVDYIADSALARRVKIFSIIGATIISAVVVVAMTWAGFCLTETMLGAPTWGSIMVSVGVGFYATLYAVWNSVELVTFCHEALDARVAASEKNLQDAKAESAARGDLDI